MAWLNFGLPLEEELEVEKQARAIRDCPDIEQLRAISEQVYRAWVQQADITRQLYEQLMEAEALLAQAGILPEPEEEYLTWAREHYPDASRSGHS